MQLGDRHFARSLRLLRPQVLSAVDWFEGGRNTILRQVFVGVFVRKNAAEKR
jgi:hypothetical protein